MVAIVSGNSLGLSFTSASTLGQGGVIGSAAQGRSGELAYVNVANGNLVLQRRDDYLSSVGQDFDAVRTYNSQGKFNDDNGDNWSIGIFNQPLQLTGTANAPGSSLVRTAPDGAQSVYTFDDSRGLYVSTDGAGAYDTIAFDSASSQYTWKDGSSGLTERYDGSAGAKLISRTDANGNTTSFAYNTSTGLLASVTDPSGQTAYYDYSGTQLTQIRTVSDGVTTTRVHYAYDGSNRLSSVTVDLSPGDNAVADGKTYVTAYTYDGASKRVASVAQTDGTQLTIAYVQIGADYRVASITDGLNQTTSYSYDTTTQRTTVIDPLGVASTYAFDTQGQLTQLHYGVTTGNPNGLTQLLYRYDTQGNVVALVDGLGHATNFQYDANGNQTLKTDALGNTVTSTYNAQNQVLTETITGPVAITIGTPLTMTSRYVYDAAGKNQLRFQISAEGRVTEYRYDAAGLQTSSITYGAGLDVSAWSTTVAPTESQMVSWAGAQDLTLNQRSNMERDFRGQLKLLTTFASVNALGEGVDGTATHYVYSQAGELLQTVQPNTASTTVYAYDGLGRVIVSTGPSSDGVTPNTTLTNYDDANGNSRITYTNGLSQLSHYDAAGRLVSVMQSSQLAGALGTTTYTYDQDGRLVMTQDPTGVRQYLVYDAAGRKVAEVDGTGAAVEYVYNTNNQVTQTIAYATPLSTSGQPKLVAIQALTNADDRKAWAIYDADGRLAWQVDALGYVTQTDYDSASRIVSVRHLTTPINTGLLGNASQLVADGALLGEVAPALTSSVVALLVLQATSTPGSPVALTAVVIGSNPGGSVSFYNGATLLGNAVISNGVATLTVTLPAGANRLTARYAGDAANTSAASATVTETVIQSGTATTVGLSASASSVTMGGNVTFTAAVSGASPTGTVSFFNGTALLGTVSVVNGQASLSVAVAAPALPAGTNTITASYSGDTGNASNVSANVVLSVQGIASPDASNTHPTTTTLTSSASQANVGAQVTLTATIGTVSGAPTPTGTVTFYNGATALGTATLVNGVASLTTSALPLGSDSLSAVYSGDANSTASTAASVTVVTSTAATTTTLTSSANQANVGAPVTLTATIAAASGAPTPTGTVTFYNGATALGTASLVNGVASFTTSALPVGSDSLFAVYSGDTNSAASTSASVALVTTTAPTTTTLTSNTSLANVGAPVTLTATIGTASGAATPTGTVTFYNGATALGTATLVNGVASFTTSALPLGSDSLSAVYSGDANSAASTAASVAVVTTTAPTTFTLTSGASQANVGAPVTLTAMIGTASGAPTPTGTVTFYNGSTALGTSTLVNGVASFTTSALPLGSDSLSAVYSGDAANAAGSSASLVESITQPINSNLITAFASSTSSAGQSSPVTLSVQLAGANPSGTVTFFSGTTVLGVATVTNGAATLVTTALPVGTDSLKASYSGDANNAASISTQSVNVTVTAAALPTPSITLSSSSSTSVKNAAVRFSVNMGAPNPGFPPTGNVTFYSGTTALGTVGLSDGIASLSVSSLAVGSNAITVTYVGDAANATVTSTAITQTVTAAPAAVSLAVSNTSRQQAQSETLTATVTGSTPGGTVTFFNGQTALGTATISGGTAVLTTVLLRTVGTASITAVYAGDTNNASATSTAKSVTITTNSSLPAAPTLPPASTTVLSTSPASAGKGQYVTLTANVSGGTSGVTPTGTVTFFNGSSGAALGSAVLVNGQASLSLANLPIASNAITAVYSGDTQAATSTSSAATETVAKATSSATLGVTIAGRYGITDDLMLTARVAGAAPGGTVTFYNGSTALGTATLSNGIATFYAAGVAVGSATLSVQYAGDTNNTSSTSATTTLSLQSAGGMTFNPPDSATVGSLVTLVAYPWGSNCDTGTVSFFNGSTLLGTVNVQFNDYNNGTSTGVATFVTSSLPVGSNNLTAVYSGSTNGLNRPITTTGTVATITAAATTTTLASSATQTTVGASVTLTASIGTASGAPTPTGTVTFYNGSTALGTATLVNGVASFATTALPQGTDSLHAVYAGDTNSVTSTSANVNVITSAATSRTTTTTLTSSASRANVGAPVTLTATIAAGSGSPAPTGTVTFYNGATALGTGTLVNGVASFTTSALPLGSDRLSAAYSGDANSTASTAASVTVVTTTATTTATLTSSATRATVGAPVTLTATISTAIGAPTPTGAVTFYNGSTALGTATLVNGVASLTSSALPLGSDRLSAVYSGDTNSTASTAASVTVVTSTAATTTTLTSSATQATVGAPVTLTATIATASGAPTPTGTVTFYNGATALGTATLVNGVASLTTSALPLGSDQLSAAYAGDANSTASTAASVTVVTSTAATTATLTSSASQANVGTSITLTATLASASGAPTPTGTVTFYNGSTAIGTATLVNGVASLSTDALPSGTDSLHAVYGGNTGSTASTSASLNIRITQPVAQADNLTPTQVTRLTAGTVTQGGTVQIQVSGGSPAGTVTLLAGTIVLGSAQLVNGVASFAASALPAGTSNLIASYTGQGGYASSALQFSQTVTAGSVASIASAVTLGSTVTRTGPTNGLTLTAQVVGTNPTGSVTFYNGTQPLGTVSLTYGIGVLSLASLPFGLDAITAVYAGDAANAAGVSAALPISVLSAATQSHTITLTYLTSDQVQSEVYDHDGLLRGGVDGEGYLTEYRYNTAGQQIASIRYASKVLGYTDAASIAGALETARRAGNVYSLRPGDSLNDPNGNPDNIQTTCFYNARGQKTGEIDGEGYLTEYGYDANGNLTSSKRQANTFDATTLATVRAGTGLGGFQPASSYETRISTWTYDALNRVQTETNAEGTVTRYSYDSMGRLTKTVNAFNTNEVRIYNRRYDLQGRLTGELSAEGAVLLNNDPVHDDQIWAQYSITHTYDAAGRRATTTDQNGHTTLFYYDADSRLTQTVNAMGEVTRTDYNAFGQVKAQIQLANRVNTLLLDGGLASPYESDRLDNALDAIKDTRVTTAYNTTGTVASITDSVANALSTAQGVTLFSYDAFRQVTDRTLGAGSSNPVTQHTAYDRRGLATQVISDAQGVQATAINRYDAFGRAYNTRDANGNWTRYEYDHLGRQITSYQPHQGEFATAPVRTRTVYDAFDRVLSQTDALGQTTGYSYSLSGRSVIVTTPENIHVTTTHTRLGQTLSATDDLGNETKYAYDKNGQLTGTTTLLTSTSQTYDHAGLLTDTYDANGNRVQLIYDAANRVLTRAVDPDGLNLVTHYEYDAKGEQISVTDPKGNITKFEYNVKGELTSQTVDQTGLALTTLYNHDARGNTVQVTDPNGSITAYSFDALGRRTSTTVDPGGLNIVTQYTYDSNGNVVRVVSPNEHTQTYAHDRVTWFTYDSSNRLVLTLTDVSDAVTEAATGSLANRGSVQENIYDADGRLAVSKSYAKAIDLSGLADTVSDSDIRARLQPDAAHDAVEKRVYNRDGQVTTTVNAAGGVVKFVYDKAGNVTLRTAYATPVTVPSGGWTLDSLVPAPTPSAAGQASQDQSVQTVYDKLNRAILTIDGVGAVVQNTYDPNGNVVDRIAFTQKLPATVNRSNPTALLSAVTALVDPATDSRLLRRFDKANRVVLSEDGTGAVTGYGYDSNGNLTRVSQYATRLTTLTTALLSQPAETTDDHIQVMAYDKANRQTFVIDAAGMWTQRQFDPAGNVVRETTYGNTGFRLDSQTDADAMSDAALRGRLTAGGFVNPAFDRTTRHFYDRANRQYGVVDAEGAVTVTLLNTQGQATEVTQYAKPIAANTVALLDGLISSGQTLDKSGLVALATGLPDQDRTTRYRYDAAGNLQFTIAANGLVNRNSFDGMGRLIETVQFAKSYATTTQATLNTDFFSEGHHNDANGVNLDKIDTFAYDAASHLSASTDAAGKTESYGYDGLGQKLSYTNKTQAATWQYTYDAAGRLTQEKSPPVELVAAIGYGSNPDTAPIIQQLAEPASVLTQMAYDARGNVTSRTEAAGRAEERTTTYVYDNLDRQVKTYFPPVKVYDLALDNLTSNGSSGPANRIDTLKTLSTETTYDVFGNAVANRDTGGNWSHKTYDKDGRVVFEVDAMRFVTGYSRDPLGNVTLLTRHASELDPSVEDYSEINLLLNVNSDGDRTVRSTFDRLGRTLTSQAPAVFTYDSRSGVTTPKYTAAPLTSNTYNAFGELIRTAVLRTPARTVAMDYYGGGSNYGGGSYYGGVGNDSGGTAAEWLTTHYYYDTMGRNNATVDAAGNLTWKEYDLAGNLTSQKEYATSLTAPTDVHSFWTTDDNISSAAQWPTLSSILTLISTKLSPQDDRTTTFTYDQLNRNTSEVKKNVTYTVTDPGKLNNLQAIDSFQNGGGTTTGDLTTSYTYDAVGNLTSTTDASGATTHTYYDKLGRVRAVAAPAQNISWFTQATNSDGSPAFNPDGSPTMVRQHEMAAPLTEFKRDALGNAVLTIAHARGTVQVDVLSYSQADDGAGGDRTTIVRYDALGHAVQTVDAQGVSHNSSYDAQGHLAKTWQTVAVTAPNGSTSQQTIFTAYAYDALGRLTNTYTPVTIVGDSTLQRLGNTTLEYDPFGEVTRKTVGVGEGNEFDDMEGAEFADYDANGRVWRTNAGDGVVKVYLYDLQGNRTAEIRSAKLDLRSRNLDAIYGIKNDLETTEQRFDSLGQMVETLAPERSTSAARAVTSRENLVFASIEQSNDGSAYSPIGNQVNLTWRSLQDLGSGDVQVTLNYTTKAYSYDGGRSYDGTPLEPRQVSQQPKTVSVILSAEEAELGYSLRWDDATAAGTDKGISSITSVVIKKKDLNGDWVTLYDVQTQDPHTIDLKWSVESSSGLYVWNSPAPGLKPMYRYYNKFNDDHFTSTSLADRDAVLNHLSGWVDEGIVGYVSESPGYGLTALYRLNKPGTDQHVYTTDAWMATYLLPSQGWELTGTDGIDGYIPKGKTPDSSVLLTLAHSNGPGQLPDHIYVTVGSPETYSLLGSNGQYGGPHTSTIYGQGLSQSIEVALPEDLVSTTTLQLRPYGSSTAGWQSVPATAMATFSGAYRFDLAKVQSLMGLSPGGYEFQVVSADRFAAAQKTLATGTFTLPGAGVSTDESLPAFSGVSQGTALIDGNTHNVLLWPAQPANLNVLFRFKPHGSTQWQTWDATNGIFGSDRTNLPGMQCVALDNLPAGNFDYEVRVIDKATGDTTHSIGTLSLSSMTAIDSTPPMTLTNSNVDNLGIVGYLWTTPYPWRMAVHRYYQVDGNDHHVLTADPHEIAYAESVLADQAAHASDPNPPPLRLVDEGIIGYVDMYPYGNSKPVYSFVYGNSNTFRWTADMSQVGSFVDATSPDQPRQDGVWYRSVYQSNGYISSVPEEGSIALYGLYDKASFGNQPIGDYFNTANVTEAGGSSLLNTTNMATAKVPNLATGVATIDGTFQAVLQWQAPEQGSRVTVTATPALPGSGVHPYIFSQDDSHQTELSQGAGQCIVLQGLEAGVSYTISVVIEHTATAARGAYLARTDMVVTGQSANAGGPVRVDTTPAVYMPQMRINNLSEDTEGRPIEHRQLDRWGNVLAVSDPRFTWDSGKWRTTYAYNADNQMIRQDRPVEGPPSGPDGKATTTIYYDQLGRQVGVKDALNHVNVQTFDAAGNLVQERHADLGQSDYAYDAFGDKVQSGVKMTESHTAITQYGYDKLSHLTNTSLASSVTAYRYDLPAGTDILADPKSLQETENDGLLKSFIQQNRIETNTYDEAGRKISVTHGSGGAAGVAGGETTRYSYDRAGNLTYSGQVDNSSTPATELLYATSYTYDAQNRKIRQVDGNGNLQTWTYTQTGQLIGHTDFGLIQDTPASQATQATYTITYNYRYDNAGRLIHQGTIDPSRGSTYYYDSTAHQYVHQGESTFAFGEEYYDENFGQMVRQGAGASESQDLTYTYDNAGQLTRIRDNYLGQTTTYTYDLAGNRLSEKLTQSTQLLDRQVANVVYQDNHMAYDAQGRLLKVADGRTNVEIAYDKAGNRTSVKTQVINTMDGVDHLEEVSISTFGYDAMNRETSGNARHYAYDLAGNRIREIAVLEGDIPVHDTAFKYDDLNRMIQAIEDGTEVDQRQYDGAGRVVFQQSQVEGGYQYRYSLYTNGLLSASRSVMRKFDNNGDIQRDSVSYTGADAAGNVRGYDAAGNLLGYTSVSESEPMAGNHEKHFYVTQDNTFRYDHLGSYLQTQQDVHRHTVRTLDAAPPDETVTTRNWYDANGFLVNSMHSNDWHYDTAFVNDAQGRALYANQGASPIVFNPYPDLNGYYGGTIDPYYEGDIEPDYADSTNPLMNGHTRVFNALPDSSWGSGRLQNLISGFVGGTTGNPVNSGHIQRQLVVNGEVLGRYGEEPATPGGDTLTYRSFADFMLDTGARPPVNGGSAGDGPIRYTVSQGETLRSIARAVLGDESLWYLIAQANGLSGATDPVAGQSLDIPMVALSHNNNSVFKPYDPSGIRGNGAVLPPLALPPGESGGWGVFGTILQIIITAVVAYFTAGAAVGVLGSVGGAAFGAAVGSLAGQTFAVATGMQQDFDFKQVALSALTAGVTEGLVGSTPLGSDAPAFANAVARGAIGNALTQGIGVVTGLQRSFNWAGVAASGIGAGVGAALSDSIMGAEQMGPPQPEQTLPRIGGLVQAWGGGVGAQVAGSALLGLAAGTATALARGGRVSVQQIATDAFGNALGGAFVENVQNAGTQTAKAPEVQGYGPWSDVGYVNEMDRQSDWASIRRQNQPYFDQIVGAFGSVPPVDASDEVSLAAAGKGFTLARGSLESPPYTGQGLKLPSGYTAGTFGPVGHGSSVGAFGSAMNWLTEARTNDQAFYTDSINGAGSGVAASLYTVGRALNGAAYDLGQGAATLYGLATDSDVRSRVFSGLSGAAGSFLDNPLGSLTRGGYTISNYFGNTSIGQMGEDALRFGSGFLAGAGAGRLAGAASGLAFDTAGTGLRYTINALPESSFNSFMQVSNFIDRAAYNLSPSSHDWAGITAGAVGSSLVPTGLKMSGVVEVRVPMWATAAQKVDYALYTRVANEALDAGYLSPAGRVSTKGALRDLADSAIEAERRAATAAGRPYQGVVGHGPDTTWTGKPDAYRWLDQDWRVNSSLGGQSSRYPIGFKPTGFVLKGMQ